MSQNKVFGISSDALKQYIEKIEHLELEKAEIANFIREAYLEAKSSGFDPKIIRQVIKERKMDPKDIDEQETMLLMYKRALGMLPELDQVA
jgi:uncharacterized protein (UPF0335 family)